MVDRKVPISMQAVDLYCMPYPAPSLAMFLLCKSTVTIGKLWKFPGPVRDGIFFPTPADTDIQ